MRHAAFMNISLHSFQVHLELLSGRDYYIISSVSVKLGAFLVSADIYILECGLATLLLALCQFQVFTPGCLYTLQCVCVSSLDLFLERFFLGGGALSFNKSHI